MPLTTSPLRDSVAFLLASVRCIKSWSSPVMAITMNMPARNCFQKYFSLLGSSKKNMRAVPLSAMRLTMLPPPTPRHTNTMHSTTLNIRHRLLSVSVHITVFTPPCSV